MPLKLKKTVKQMLAEANAEVETIQAADALKLKDDPGIVFVDIRDIRELDRDGRIPGALHAPRGMLEFWVDPESPYHDPAFRKDRTVILYCASGGRSALAGKVLKDFGYQSVFNAGAFKDLVSAGLEKEQG